jgi:hypothetical protein
VRIEELSIGDCVDFTQNEPIPGRPQEDYTTDYRTLCQVHDDIFVVLEVPPGDWEIVHPDLENPGVSDNSTFDVDSLRTVPGATGGAFYGVKRSFGFKGNAIVDVSVRGLNILFESSDILAKIMGNFR